MSKKLSDQIDSLRDLPISMADRDAWAEQARELEAQLRQLKLDLDNAVMWHYHQVQSNKILQAKQEGLEAERDALRNHRDKLYDSIRRLFGDKD